MSFFFFSFFLYFSFFLCVYVCMWRGGGAGVRGEGDHFQLKEFFACMELCMSVESAWEGIGVG